MRSRIAIFEGYNKTPFKRRRRSMGAHIFADQMGFAPRTMPAGMGAPLFNNPRMQAYGAPLFNNPRMQEYGRAAYYVAPGFVSDGRSVKPRKGYKVKAKRNTPAMAKVQRRFKKAAKKCSRQSRNKRKGAYQSCMRKALKAGRRSKR